MKRKYGWPVILAAALTGVAAAADGATDEQTLERGRYLVSIAGCNDCHTPHYPERGGNIPAGDWLTGSAVGFQGPWGTAYPGNLRLHVQSMSETAWLENVRREMRPPMPWFALRAMNDQDVKAIYHFIRSLGPKGDPAPAFAPPGLAVSTPYIEFVPKSPAPSIKAEPGVSASR